MTEICNRTPHDVLAFPVPLAGGRSSLTLVVKGTYELVPDGSARPAATPLAIQGDDFHQAANGTPLGLRYASDLAPYKPVADVLLTGAAFAPGGQAVPAFGITFAVGTWVKRLVVHGDRPWFGTRAGPARPVRRQILRDDAAFGGPDFAANPVGRGRAATPQGWLLPNLELPEAPVTDPGFRGLPARLGPVPMTWPPRAGRAGRFGTRWLAEDWPGFPAEFDWGFFNAAPPDQQWSGFLRGDEPVGLENLHPRHGRLTSRLPGVRPRCVVVRDTADGPGHVDVAMNLDTLWLDSETLTLVLVWRGRLRTARADGADVRGLLVVEEDLTAPPADAARLARDLAEAQAPASVSAAPPPEPVAATAPAPRPAPRPAPALAAGADLVGRDLAGINLSGRDLTGVDLRDALLDGADLSGCTLTKARLDGAQLGGAVLAGARSAGARLAGADLSGVRLDGASLAGADLTDADLTDADLTGADLTDARLDRAVLRRAVLTDAQCGRAGLVGVDLTRARLDRAVFTLADLTGAILAEAVGAGVRFDDAILARASGENCRLAGGRFPRVRGAGSAWLGADLQATDWSGALLPRAVFQQARMAQAVLAGCDLATAILSHAVLPMAVLAGSQLRQARLEGADARQADFSDACCHGVDFNGARLDGAIWERTILTGGRRDREGRR